MSVTVRKVESRKDYKAFIEFPNSLYKGNPYYCPKLFTDEMSTLRKDKNPAFEICEAEYFLAYKDGRLAGRVAAIVNYSANKTWNHDEVRFGWIDFIDDLEVSKALTDAVVEYGKSKGMTQITGPLGFTDFDPEGMMIEGYDQLVTMPLIYNYPYYVDHMKALGFEKEATWLEYKIYIPSEMPEKYSRMADVISERYNLKVTPLTRQSLKKLKLGQKMFELINETYAPLYNFTILPQGLIDKYMQTYLGLLDKKFISLVTDENMEVVGFGCIMPSIVRALRKCGGKLFPFGWWHVIKSMFLKYEENVELLLIGVKSEYQKKGVNALIFYHLIKTVSACGFKYAETNAELEENTAVQSLWTGFETEQHKKRAAFTKKI